MLGDRLKVFLSAWFGNFSRDELFKYVFLGVIFIFLIGSYWTLRSMKELFFGFIVSPGKTYIASAKMLSVVVLFPLVLFYNWLLTRFEKRSMIYLLLAFYFVGAIIFGLLLINPVVGLPNTALSTDRYLGWAWYVFIESYGSLVIALFWAFSSDISLPESAKRGFPLILMIGQIGSFGMPLIIWKVLLPKIKGDPYLLGGLVFVVAAVILIIMLLVKIFLTLTPPEQLISYEEQKAKESEKKREKAGFIEGLKLLFSEPYLLGIFALVGFNELIATIVDLNFKGSVLAHFAGDKALTAPYMFSFSVWVNLVTFLCYFFGISNIQRRLGLNISLPLVPIIVVMYLVAFISNPVMNTLFWIMVVAKAVNYALNSPATKQLYVPTSSEAKYKSQSWIETFGSRISKVGGSAFVKIFMKGKSVAPLVFYSLFGVAGIWFFIAVVLSRKYNTVVAKGELAC